MFRIDQSVVADEHGGDRLVAGTTPAPARAASGSSQMLTSRTGRPLPRNRRRSAMQNGQPGRQ